MKASKVRNSFWDTPYTCPFCEGKSWVFWADNEPECPHCGSRGSRAIESVVREIVNDESKGEGLIRIVDD